MMLSSNYLRILLIVGAILLIPLFGNLFINGWNWSPMGFVFAGVLLYITGLVIDFVRRKIANPTNRIIAIILIVLAFLAFWSELAVDAVSQTLKIIF